MSKKPMSFGALSVNGRPPAQPAAELSSERQEAGGKQEGAAAKLGKTIPVRLTRQQWLEAKDFAMHEDKSLQELFIKGINALRAEKGLPPLNGTYTA